MVNHPNRNRGPYTAQISGHSISRGAAVECRTLAEARDHAESYGTTADHCTVSDRTGRVVAQYRRAGSSWYRAEI